MSRALTIVSVISVLIIAALVISLALVLLTTSSDESDETCLTPECFQTSLRLLNDINPAIEPCENFYEFACGKYLAFAPIPEGEIEADQFMVVNREIEQRLKTLIEEKINPDDPRAINLAKNYFNACMNTTHLEKVGLEPIKRTLAQYGGWPVLDGNNWKQGGFSWVESVYKSRQLGYSTNHFIGVSVTTDLKNSSVHTIKVDQPEFGISREFLIDGFEGGNVQVYYEYMIDIAVILGANRARAVRELKESLEFEIKLALISLPDEQRRNYTLLHNPMTVAELIKRYPSVNWEEYINKLMTPVLQIDKNEIVAVYEPDLISGLEKLIQDTPKRIQANYVGWRVVLESALHLTKAVRKRTKQFNAEMTGLEETSEPRWKECLAVITDSTLGTATNALYVRRFFKEKARQMVSEIVTDIRNELIKILEKSDWMDETTKRRALDKAVSMFAHVAYPVELLDDKTLDKMFATVVMKPNNYLEMHRNLTKFTFEYLASSLRLPVNKTDWVMHEDSTNVNAAYGPTDNSIEIPAGILQGVFFSDDRPQYMNYGAMGYLIGHEMTHSFDNEGRQFDKDGNVVDWWTPQTAEKYLQKAQCFINQYNNYVVPSIMGNVDGDITQGENIADNGGIKEAYFAYKEYVRRNGPEPKLPGLNYTSEQLFWLSAANLWCTRYAPDSALYELTTDVHSPERFRVIGAFSNMPEFAKDFNCKLGSPMNPKHKCSIL